jgi:hypothetical protein
MARATYVLRDGELIEKHLAPPPPRGPRSSLPRPYFIGDTVEMKSMADGRMYTSKAAYRADLRARGLVEVGNDTAYVAKPPPDAETIAGDPGADLAQAWEQLS